LAFATASSVNETRRAPPTQADIRAALSLEVEELVENGGAGSELGLGGRNVDLDLDRVGKLREEAVNKRSREERVPHAARVLGACFLVQSVGLVSLDGLDLLQSR
jgi:hypothetical protein